MLEEQTQINTKSTSTGQQRSHPLAQLTGAPEVHDLDGGSLGVAEQDVLGLEVTVDDAQLRRGQEEQRGAQLLSKLARQVQRHAAEIGVPQQVVQVIGQHLKDQTQVVPEHEMTFQMNCRRKKNTVALRCDTE